MNVSVKNSVEFKAIQYDNNLDKLNEFLKENLNKEYYDYSLDEFDGILWIYINDQFIFTANRFDYIIISDIFQNKIRVVIPERFNEYFIDDKYFP